MSALVSRAQVKSHLGLEDDDDSQDTLIDTLITAVESTFLRDCGRAERAFQAAETGRAEVHDGNSRAVLWLDYPITALTSVQLGNDPTDWDEELDVADVDVLIYQTGKARLVRVDGGRFGEEWQANYVTVTYDAAADLPDDARQAVVGAIAAIVNRRGSEGQTSERVGPYSTDYSELLSGNGSITAGDPLWRAAVAHHREVHV